MNDTRSRRAVMIGMDGASMDLVLLMIREGHMPNLKRLVERGVHAPMLGVLPTLTPPGWTSLVTGAWPGTHGVTEFCMHRSGRSFDDWEQGIDTGQCRAEYLWNTCERGGRLPILVKWEMSWPPTVEAGLQVEGSGPGTANYSQIAGYHCFVAGRWAPRTIGGRADPQNVDPSRMEDVRQIDPVAVEPLPKDRFRNVPASSLPVRLIRLVVRPLARTPAHMRRGESGEPKELSALVYATGPGGYDRVRVARSTDAADALADLGVGDWSDWVKERFRIDGEQTGGYLRLKLLTLAPDLSAFELFAPQVWGTDRYTHPQALGGEIDREVGNFLQNPARDAIGVIDDETYFELLDFHHQRLHQVAAHLCRSRPEWAMLFTETHASDFANHAFLGMADPVSGADAETLARCRRGLERTYASIDRWIGELLKLAGENAVVVVGSDHGGTPNRYPFVDAGRVLEAAGLTVYKTDGGGKRIVDFARSRALAHPHNLLNIFVNLKGRDPEGIVAPEDYHETQLEVIDALYAHREPASGHCPFSLALTREDARMVNLWGERLGDVVYTLRPEYDGAHGRQLPTARLGIGSQRSTFVMAGPGVKRGAALQRLVRVVDVAPTVCRLIGLPMPRDVEGGVIHEALGSPFSPCP